jgi:hypothetical protein
VLEAAPEGREVGGCRGESVERWGDATPSDLEEATRRRKALGYASDTASAVPVVPAATEHEERDNEEENQGHGAHLGLPFETS